VRQVQLEADDVLRNIRTGVLTVDADGRLLYANPASEEILGFRAREWLGKSVMPEFARLAPEFWAAVTSTARRGVRLMRVEATVHRPDRSFPIGVTTTTLDGPVGARPRVSPSSPTSPIPSGSKSCTCARSGSRPSPSCRPALRMKSRIRWRPFAARSSSSGGRRAPTRTKSFSPI